MDRLTQLKKEGKISKKWATGKTYVKGFADLENGRSNELSFYEMIGYSFIVEESSLVQKYIIHLKNLDTGEVIKISEDDRYGKYPLLDKKRKSNIFYTYNKMKRIADTLEKHSKHWM